MIIWLANKKKSEKCLNLSIAHLRFFQNDKEDTSNTCQYTKYSTIEIEFESSVEEWTSEYKINLWSVLSTLGGALGLWLGLGILQLGQNLMKFLKNAKNKIDQIKTKTKEKKCMPDLRDEVKELRKEFKDLRDQILILQQKLNIVSEIA